MTKADIAERIHTKLGFTKKESAELLEGVFAILKKTLSSGEKIKIAGFGKFEVKNKAQRRGRNPVTGEAMAITPRKVLTFKSSRLLKKQMNSD